MIMNFNKRGATYVQYVWASLGVGRPELTTIHFVYFVTILYMF